MQILLLTLVGFEANFIIFFFISFKINVYSFTNILRSFTKYTVIHKLKEVFFNWIFSISSLVFIEIYVLF